MVERREGGHADQRTFEFADVALDLRCDELEDVVGHADVVHLRFLAQDGDAGFQLGRLDVCDETPLEPGS